MLCRELPGELGALDDEHESAPIAKSAAPAQVAKDGDLGHGAGH
jgi:hypothetical protein